MMSIETKSKVRVEDIAGQIATDICGEVNQTSKWTGKDSER
jgi:hypothetical protein